jgi:hypothetical protein
VRFERGLGAAFFATFAARFGFVACEETVTDQVIASASWFGMRRP